MKRNIVLMLAVMLLCCVMCVALADAVPSPVTVYSSLQELNLAVGCNLHHPAVMGVEDVAYLAIDCGDYLIGEYDYKVNGQTYMLRASAAKNVDISGIYCDGKTLFEGKTLPEKGLQYAFAEGERIIAARWLRPNGHSYLPSFDDQYVLVAFDVGEDFSDTFRAIAEETALIVSLDWDAQLNMVFCHQLAGEYQDSWSQRATAEIKMKDQRSVLITVHWSSSAWEYTEWTMTAEPKDSCSRLIYRDCVCRNIICDDQGCETAAIVYENGTGWFDCVPNVYTNEVQLKWSGAADEQCRECSFMKMAK